MKYVKEETRFFGKYSSRVFQSIAMAIGPYRNRFIICLTFGFLSRLFFLGNTNVIGKWADSLCKNSPYCHSTGIFSHFSNHDFFILLLTLSSFGFFFLIFFRIYVARLGTLSSSRMYDETTIRVSRFPMSFFDTNPVGRIITRFSSDYGAVFRMAGGPLGEFLSIAFDVVLFFILIVVASPYYIPIVLFSVLLNFIVYKLNQKHLRKKRREHSLSKSPVISHFAETAQGSRVIRSYQKQSTFQEQFLLKLKHYLAQKNNTNFHVSFFSFQMSLLNTFVLCLTAMIGLWMIQKQYVSIGSLGVAFTFIAMTSSTIQIFFEWISSIEDALTGTERISEYLFAPLEPGALLPSNSDFQTNHPNEKNLAKKSLFLEHSETNQTPAIQVENLSLKYQPNLPFALQEISFDVKVGEKVGIIGKTGSGKSTLIQALFHLYPFHSGKISVFGKQANLNFQEESNDFIFLEEFRKKIFLLTQEPILYRGTLRENFTLDTKVTDDEILHIAKIVGLEKFILSQPQSLSYLIEEKGANISSGERQLICMARCLLQNSPIILMDEATSSVDPQTEAMLVDSTKHLLKGKTRIIVAHRLSTIADCDKVIWLHQGRIVQVGSPEIVIPVFQEFEKSQ